MAKILLFDPIDQLSPGVAAASLSWYPQSAPFLIFYLLSSIAAFLVYPDQRI